MNKNTFQKPMYISLKTVELWIKQGVIWLESIGQENIYFTDEFGMTYYFKVQEEL